MDDPFCESTTNLLGTNEVISRVRQTRTHANSSTHSLNEAELQVGSLVLLHYIIRLYILIYFLIDHLVFVLILNHIGSFKEVYFAPLELHCFNGIKCFVLLYIPPPPLLLPPVTV